MATEMIKGQKVEDALKLSNKAVVEALDGLPPAKIHCSVLAEQAVKAALADYYTKNGIELDPAIFGNGSCGGHCDGCDSCGIEG
jgi:nitrogen fixation NifU-like protein